MAIGHDFDAEFHKRPTTTELIHAPRYQCGRWVMSKLSPPAAVESVSPSAAAFLSHYVCRIAVDRLGAFPLCLPFSAGPNREAR